MVEQELQGKNGRRVYGGMKRVNESEFGSVIYPKVNLYIICLDNPKWVKGYDKSRVRFLFQTGKKKTRKDLWLS